MYENLRGKRLLFLGAVRPLCEPVKIAKEMGIHTIVIDYLPDSPAKRVADEAYLVSTTDVDAVVALCKEKHVDGLFTSNIDSMLPYAREICDRLGFPFYASRDQIRMSLDKRYFKEKCTEYGVPVAKDYTDEILEKGIEAADIQFPVIVKPVDSSGGRGVSICNMREELQSACDYAMEISPGKNILVEEYLQGVPICMVYTIKNGEISLSSVKDDFTSEDHEDITSLFEVALTPSRYLRRYMETANPLIISMLKGMHATDGAIFFQGVVTKDKIALFELGYRPGGAQDYKYISHINGINYMKMMLAHSLTGSMDGYELSQDNPFFQSYACVFYIFLHGGTIGYQSGLKEIQNIENVIFAEFTHDIGETIADDNTLNQRGIRAIIVDSSLKNIQNTIKKIQETIQIRDTEGKDMCYLSFDVHRLDIYPEEVSQGQ